jgi:hypothetical protein
MRIAVLPAALTGGSPGGAIVLYLLVPMGAVVLAIAQWRCAFNVHWRGWGWMVRGLILLSTPLGLVMAWNNIGLLLSVHSPGYGPTAAVSAKPSDTSLETAGVPAGKTLVPQQGAASTASANQHHQGQAAPPASVGGASSRPQSGSLTFSAPKYNLADAITWTDEHGDATRIFADGEITTRSASDLSRFVRVHRIERAVVLFNSPGGSLMGGLALGTTIRKLGFDTGIATFAHGEMVMSGICASACAYAFAGGRARYYYGGNTKLGIHQFYSQGKDFGNATSQELSGLLVAYLQRMGVDALAFSASASVQPNAVLWLSAADAIRLHFANNGTAPTTAELKQVQGVTYLRVEQRYTHYSARFIFDCAPDGGLWLMGGIVTNPQNAKQTYDWATQSFFTFDDQTIQLKRKGTPDDGLSPDNSVIWVTRTLAPAEVQKLLESKTITTWVAADGAVGNTGAADISLVRDKLRDFVDNCKDSSQVNR